MQRVTLLGKGMVVSLQDGATNRRVWRRRYRNVKTHKERSPVPADAPEVDACTPSVLTESQTHSAVQGALELADPLIEFTNAAGRPR